MSMNAVRKPTLPLQPVTPEKTPERRLQPVTAPAQRRKPKLAYALVALGGALAIGAAQVGLSLAITQDSFTLAGLTSQQRELDLRTDALQEELTGLSSPQVLASSAADLGMVVAGAPSYLRLSDGAVFGTGAGAEGVSTIDPNGKAAVGNVLVTEDAPPPATTDDAADSTSPAPNLPPAITDGLPSPTTH
ncbi:hypothetical protein [Microbacterium sp. BLY]|uniref:hypothetical protein n=1 Tax=Microbacterium sp. BLY TaxID=2823280 RepID=UPI001B331330|nr:hypothetical protein [Microbacterium sp. BLY]MBP3978801.1 hypothetical protein [Microbacterium sp. BLY]